MRGFGSGLIWGGVVGALGLVIASEMAPLPGRLPVTAPDAPPLAEQTTGTAPDETALPEAGAAGSAPVVTATSEPPVADSAAPAAEAATAGGATDERPAAAPVDVPAGSEFARPLPDVEPALPQGAAAPATGPAPGVSRPEAQAALPSADTAPLPPPEPDLLAPVAPSAPEMGDSESAGASALATAPETGASPDLTSPAPEGAPAAADLPPPPPLTPEEEALVRTAPVPGPETAPENAPDPTTLPDAGTGSVPEEAEEEVIVLTPERGFEPDEPLAPSAITRPETGFSGEVAGVTTNRLPRIGDAPALPDEGGLSLDGADLTPLQRFARSFDNPQNKPLFSIVLIDRGDAALDRASLAGLPFPVTFALDPTVPNVAELAAVYRAAGQEVAMLATAIPEGATASDLEVTFAAHEAALPEAVAVVDAGTGGPGGFQDDRPLSTQVVEIVKGQGRGLLTYEVGLNPADQVASREEVPAATVFRVLDAEGESAPVMRRYLDRAAFKAAQEGRVVVAGQARPETAAALMEWTLESRASAVALAPLSAAMQTR